MKMTNKLESYEVLTGLIGMYAEKNKTNEGTKRSKLYKAVDYLLSKKPENIFPFEFNDRSGERISSDVDLGLSNLEVCGRLEYYGFSERNNITKLLKENYETRVKPKLVKMDLFKDFEFACDNFLK